MTLRTTPPPFGMRSVSFGGALGNAGGTSPRAGRSLGIRDVISIILFLGVLGVVVGMIAGVIQPEPIFDTIRGLIAKAGSIVAGVFGS